MPYNLNYPTVEAGWKVKIREKERTEPPHISVMKKQETWRWGSRAALTETASEGRAKEMIEHLQANLEKLIAVWDKVPAQSCELGR